MVTATVISALCLLAWASNPPLQLFQAPAAFEVASIKASAPIEPGGFSPTTPGAISPGGRWSAHNAPLAFIVRGVYGLRREQLAGGPAWVHSQPFDIEARADPNATPEQMTAMARALLAERFTLRMHVERRPTTVYALVRVDAEGALGPGIRPTTLDCRSLARTGARGAPQRRARAGRGRHQAVAHDRAAGRELSRIVGAAGDDGWSCRGPNWPDGRLRYRSGFRAADGDHVHRRCAPWAVVRIRDRIATRTRASRNRTGRLAPLMPPGAIRRKLACPSRASPARRLVVRRAGIADPASRARMVDTAPRVSSGRFRAQGGAVHPREPASRLRHARSGAWDVSCRQHVRTGDEPPHVRRQAAAEAGGPGRT